jgi:hypothetical protein
VIAVDLPVRLDRAAVAKRLTLRRGGRDAEQAADELVRVVESVARPRAIYRECTVKRLSDSRLGIGGSSFSSRVLGKLLNDGQTVFPYILSIGPELSGAVLPDGDMLKRYWLDTVKSMVVHIAGNSFSEHLHNKHKGQRLTHMNPGELDDWPITEQKPLFSLFGDATAELGVALTDGYMMRPAKSRSGIFFGNDDGFETCRLCSQHKCVGRRAAYDAAAVAIYTA